MNGAVSIKETKLFHLISAVFVTVLVISNIIAVKVGNFWGYFMPVGVVLFPISYIINDVLTEVYGYAAARRVIWTGFFCNLLAVVAIWIALNVAPAPFFANQTAFETILGFTPRLLAASFVAYLVGGFSNSWIMAKLKIKTQGKYLWLRTITSTIVGEGLDSVIFILIAFSGIFPGAQIVSVILTQWIFKTIFEVIATPVTYAVIRYLKKKDGSDVYDQVTNFSPLQY